MKYITITCVFIGSILAQVDLLQNENYIYNIMLETDGEYLLDIELYSDTSWEQENNESAVLTLFINGEYNQDIVIYNGNVNHTYKQAIGFLNAGEYEVELFFDYSKSSLNATSIHIEGIEFNNAFDLDIDTDVIKYSPIIYGRNIFAWNESNRTDIPLLMYYDISYENNIKTITYSLIFSNEDSRIGIGLSDMMLSWGRTTDIEWVYQISLINDGQGTSEIFQGAGHTPTVFNGEKFGTHPYLINATANCNFSDTGTSDYKFFLSPLNTPSNDHTREFLMDQNPWSYKIMGQELSNENKYEEIQDPSHWELSDVRNYIYLEYGGSQSGNNITSNISVSFYNDCYPYSNDHNQSDINFSFGNGINRTAIELPEGFNPDDLQYLEISASGDAGYSIVLNDIIQFFYLSDNFELININIEDTQIPLLLNETSPSISLVINESNLEYDCNGVFSGIASCDDCNTCSGGDTGISPNENIDECGVCFGENQDMDCTGICFGDAYTDECNICDNNPLNDGETCDAGCIDINAENYNPDAIIFDNSCIYSDQLFNVPDEYTKINDAIFFADHQDTILVEPGVYYEEVDFLGKGIILMSTQGAESTTIFANSDNDDDDGGIYEPEQSVVTIKDVLVNEAVLDGFTLQGGYGKGVDFDYFVSVASDPDMFNDMMYNHITSGGISIINSSITLTNLIIKSNIAKNFGGGIGMVNSTSNLSNIIIENNHIPDVDGLGGSGIAINGGITTIDNCIIRDNTVGLNLYQLNGGGGILCGFNFSGSPLELTVLNSEIYNNVANIGAAIGALSGNINIHHTLIYNNTGEYGSAISLGEPLGLVIDNINMTVTQSTITNNIGAFSFGLIDNSNVIMANSILWNELGEEEFTPLPNNSALNVNVFYSDIRSLENIESENSISINPLFTNEDIFELSLTSGSPCIDTGIDLLAFEGNTILDMDLSEYNGIMPDMGYFEYYNDILYGDVNLDSIIDIIDIVLMVNIIIGQNTSEIYSMEAADMNQDEIVDVIDIVALINLILDN